MPWYYAIAERDHDIQNPTSREKIRLMGEWLGLGPETRVLDIACGKCGPALVLASTFGCRITGVERYPGFVATARERVAEAGLGELIEVVESDGREFPLEPGSWDVALCLGATFVWDDLDGTLSSLVPAVRAGGHVVVGEPYWRRSPPVGMDTMGYVSLSETGSQGRAARRLTDRADQLVDRRLGSLRVAPLACGRGLARRERRSGHSARERGAQAAIPGAAGRVRLGDLPREEAGLARRRGRARAPRAAPGTPRTRVATS